MSIFISFFIGIISGIASGFFGIGGAVLMVPALVFVFKYSQAYAQGTALATLLLPVVILAVIKYYNAGNVNIKIALIIALGFVIGGFFGATFANSVSDIVLRRCFGAMIFVISLYMILGK